jgi:hypothetical protein
MAASDKRYANSQCGVLTVATGGSTGTVTQDTYVLLPGTLGTNTVVNHDLTVDTTLGKLTNSKPSDRVVRVAVDVTLTQSSGSTRTVTVQIEVDGSSVETLALSCVTATATRFSFSTLALLPTGSYVRVLVKNGGGTEAITSTTGGKVHVHGV